MEQGLFREPLANVNRLDYLSPAKLKLLNRNPRMFMRKYSPNTDYVEPAKRALTVGKHAHHCLLEPDAFSKLVVMPEFAGTGSRAAKQDWLAKLPAGAVTIDEEDKRVVERMVDSVLADPEARALIRELQGHNEVCAYAKREDGIWLHGRMDRVLAEPAIVEFKSTSTGVDWDEFVWSVYEFDYHMDMAAYIEMARIIQKTTRQAFFGQCAWIVAQSCEPHSVRVHYPVYEDLLDIGFHDMERAIERWKQLYKADPALQNRAVWFNGRQEKEEAPASFPYHIMIRRPEWQQFLTGVK